MVTNTTSFTYRPRVSLARFLFCWWRHNRLLMTSQWPDNCDVITWIVISNLLDIDFIHGDIHGRSCKKWLFAIWVQVRTICNIFSCWKLKFWLHGSLGSHRYWYRKTSRLVMFTWIPDYCIFFRLAHLAMLIHQPSHFSDSDARWNSNLHLAWNSWSWGLIGRSKQILRNTVCSCIHIQ